MKLKSYHANVNFRSEGIPYESNQTSVFMKVLPRRFLECNSQAMFVNNLKDRPHKKIQYVQKRIRKWEQRPQKWYVRSKCFKR
jgi:hypothetical protein